MAVYDPATLYRAQITAGIQELANTGDGTVASRVQALFDKWKLKPFLGSVVALEGDLNADKKSEVVAEYNDPKSVNGAGTLHPPARALLPGRSSVRGLYSGGTLAQEAARELARRTDLTHDVVDLGADQFTAGRPHPMIDPPLRNAQLLRAALDPEVAVILFDVVLGVGAHPDPAGAICTAIRAAREQVGQQVAFVASVCGTQRDPQHHMHAGRAAVLRQEGVFVLPSNALAADFAGQISAEGRRN